jgi:hypothetical protein
MEHNKFSLEGIFDLCQQYRNDIYERKDLKHVLNRRKVRFINPEGKFDYAYFGDFYFKSMERMMLVTKNRAYTRYHQCDQMGNSLWSTVPVIFAGVQTGYRDDTGREIYTGDMASVKGENGELGFTSVVRYLPYVEEPSLICDNFDMMFSMCKYGVHVQGTAFSEMKREMYGCFDPQFVFWSTSQFHMNGMSTEEVIKRAATAKNAPSFLEGCEPIKNRGNKTLYSDINDAMHGDFQFVCVDGDEFIDDEEGPCSTLYADNIPDDYEGEIRNIRLNEEADSVADQLKDSLNEFMIYAHRHPETKFIICDFAKSLFLNESEKREVAKLFRPLRQYNITNVVLPSWITIWLVTEDTLDYMCGGIPNS